MARQDNQYLPLEELTALTPLDGRYRSQSAPLATYLSEFSLIRIRMELEAAYLVALSSAGVVRKLTPEERKMLESLGPNLSLTDVKEVKKFEQTTKHDVKAVEMLFRKKVKGTSLEDLTEYIHFGLTSEDINNLAYRLMLKRATENVLLPSLVSLLESVVALAKEYKTTPMLGRTHGQAAIPTTLGKELVVFAARLHRELSLVKKHQFAGKLAGAVGNYNALTISFDTVDWASFAEKFVSSFNFAHSSAVTQTNTYEDIISFFQIIQRLNNILIDFDQDMWRYISDGWFVQEVKENEVGSSTMPQKVNPILFENSEGNLGMANAIIAFFVSKLPISRLQRDLSDSTVIRNFGSCLGYSLLGYNGTSQGLSHVTPNLTKIEEDLLEDWSILAEAVQTILRKNGVSDPYSLLKKLTRGEKITESAWKKIIKGLPVDEDIKKSLQTLSPKKYIGLAPQIVEKTIAEIQKA